MVRSAMIDNWIIRRARRSDANVLAKCIDEAYAQYANRIPDLPSVSDGCAEEILKNHAWVAVEGNNIIGCLFLVPEDAYLKLANVAVHPDHGGKGLGRKLIALSEKEAKVEGYCEMRLNTHAAMTKNIRFYIQLGWHEIGRNGNTVQMKKIL